MFRMMCNVPLRGNVQNISLATDPIDEHKSKRTCCGMDCQHAVVACKYDTVHVGFSSVNVF